MSDYQTEDRLYTRCTRGRAAFKPDWDYGRPWACYWNGTATRHFATVGEVVRYFAERKAVLIVKTPSELYGEQKAYVGEVKLMNEQWHREHSNDHRR